MMKIIVSLNEQEIILLEKLVQAGYRKAEIFRFGLRLFHNKEFPPYRNPKKRKGIEEPNSEQSCLAQGGSVIMEGGIKKCLLKDGALERLFVIE